MSTGNRPTTRRQARERAESIDTPDVLQSLFGKNTRVQTLEFLANNPDSVFLQQEIADEIEPSAAMVSRACSKLKKHGLIEHAEADSNDTYKGVTLADTRLASLLAEVLTEASVQDDV